MSDPFYRQSIKALATAVNDEVVALHVERGQCYGMQDVAATVWNLLAEPINLEGICARLAEIYDVELEVCRAEVAMLIDELHKESLIETVQSRSLPAQGRAANTGPKGILTMIVPLVL